MASIFKPARVRQFVRMEGASSEEIVNAIDEVLVWSNLFGHHMSVDDVLRNMQVRCTGV